MQQTSLSDEYCIYVYSISSSDPLLFLCIHYNKQPERCHALVHDVVLNLHSTRTDLTRTSVITHQHCSRSLSLSLSSQTSSMINSPSPFLSSNWVSWAHQLYVHEWVGLWCFSLTYLDQTRHQSEEQDCHMAACACVREREKCVKNCSWKIIDAPKLPILKYCNGLI